jgi:hypothetical protein
MKSVISTTKLPFILHKAAVLAPGLNSLDQLRQASVGTYQIDPQQPFVLPPPQALPSNERRRSSQSVRLVFTCLEQLAQNCPVSLSDLRSVFATDDGVGEISEQMFETLSGTQQVSPLTFPNSVHSATAGYFSIGYQNHQPSTVLSRGNESFAAGLLCAVTEALTTGEPVLFVCFDPAMTGLMQEVLPITQPTACVWLLSAGDLSAGNQNLPALALFVLTLESGRRPAPLPDWLPANWAPNATAQGFAALSLLETPAYTSYSLALGMQTLTLTCTSTPSGETPSQRH